jgi:hypothetical protein
MNPHSYFYLIFDKGPQNIRWIIASSTNVAGKIGYLPADPIYHPVLVSTPKRSRTLISDLKL